MIHALPAFRRSEDNRRTGYGPLLRHSQSVGKWVSSFDWRFAGSLRAGRRAAAVMSLIQSAKLNDHDAYRYLKDVLARLPTQLNSRIEGLLPHRWTPAVAGS